MSRHRQTVIPNNQANFFAKCLQEKIRLDGRTFEEFRPLRIEFGRDWGCCYTSLGNTRVVVQVSSEVQVPKSSRPSEGMLHINVELSPMAASHFEAGRPSEQAIHLNRLLEKLIKDSKAVDLESLCIKMSEKAWCVRVDVNVLNHDGNMTDCVGVAALAALCHFHRPDVSYEGEEIVVHSYQERDPIPTVMHHHPVCVTFAVYNKGNDILADPNLLEENVGDALLTMGINQHKEFATIHLSGNACMTYDKIIECASRAASRAKIVVQKIQAALEQDKKDRKDNLYKDVELKLPFLLIDDIVCEFKSRKSSSLPSEQPIIQQKRAASSSSSSSEEEEEIKKGEYSAIMKKARNTAFMMPKKANGTNAWVSTDSSESDDDVKDEKEKPNLQLIDKISIKSETSSSEDSDVQILPTEKVAPVVVNDSDSEENEVLEL